MCGLTSTPLNGKRGRSLRFSGSRLLLAGANTCVHSQGAALMLPSADDTAQGRPLAVVLVLAVCVSARPR